MTSENTQFSISIKKIIETSENSEVYSISIPNVGFTKTAIPSAGTNTNIMNNYTATLDNGAFISVVVSMSFLYCLVLQMCLYFDINEGDTI